jgi:hypothetical protein
MPNEDHIHIEDEHHLIAQADQEVENHNIQVPYISDEEQEEVGLRNKNHPPSK